MSNFIHENLYYLVACLSKKLLKMPINTYGNLKSKARELISQAEILSKEDYHKLLEKFVYQIANQNITEDTIVVSTASEKHDPCIPEAKITSFEKNGGGNSKPLVIEEMNKSFQEYASLALNGIIILHDKTIIYANKSCLKIMGLESEDLVIGKNIYDFIYPDNHEFIRTRLYKLSKGIQSEPGIIKCHTPNNEAKWVEFTGAEVVFQNKISCLVALKDISEYVQSYHEYETLIQELSVALLMRDENSILLVNKDLCELIGYSQEEILQKSTFDLLGIVHPDDMHIRKEMDGTHNIGFSKPYRMIRKDKKIIWVQSQFRKVTFHGEQVYLCVYVDVSHQYKLEQNLRLSEARYQSLSDASFESILFFDGNICVNQNLTAEKMFSYSLSEAIGKKAVEWLHPDERSRAMEAVRKKQRRPMEITAMRKDGSCFPAEAQLSEFVDNGKMIRVIALRDISARAEAYRKLRDSLNFNKNLIANMLEGLIVLDEDYKVILWNNYLEKLSNKKRVHVIGKCIRDVFSNFSSLNLEFVMQKAMQGELIEKTALPYFDKKLNKNRYIRIVLSPNRDAFGKIIGLIALVSDSTAITEYQEELRKRNDLLKHSNFELSSLNAHFHELNDELKFAKDKAVESDKLKSAFLANMSHEIRTPMNSILGFSQLLIEEEMDKEEQADYLQLLNKNSMQLLNLINDVIDLSKIEAGEMEINRDVMDIAALVNDLYSLFSSNADRKGIELRLKHSLGKENKIVSDIQRLRQIITNLLANAIKFTDTGFVEMRCFINDKTLHFEIEDSGAGISEKEQELVFERFIQAEHAKTGEGQKKGGTGLGLAISKNLVELLGGDIGLRSEPGKGSVFYFHVPYIPEARYDVKEQYRRPDLEDLKFLKGKILVAEDIESNFLFIKGLLGKMPIELIHAQNGQEAVDYIVKHDDVHLVLMDVKMPVMDGLEATRRIKKMKPELPVIAQTAFALANDRDKAFDAGCDGYLPKPIKSADLIAFLRAFLTQA